MAIELRNYLVAFVLTVVLEVAVAVVLGFRKRREIAAVVLVNVFTHPLLCYTIWLIDSIRSAPVNLVEILVFEAGVVLVEWQLLCFALRKRQKSALFTLSLTMNSVSYLAGRVIWG